MAEYGTLIDVKRLAVHDGPGIRTTFFLKGCPLKCLWCHNPESTSPQPQLAFYAHKCINCGECTIICKQKAQQIDSEGIHHFNRGACIACGACTEACLGGALKLFGQKISSDELLEIAKDDVDFYRESGGGVTLSGGEPLFQPAFTLECLAKLKSAGIHTALDTCALVSRNALEASLPVTDMYLVDFKHSDSEQHRKLTGQPNGIIKENLAFLSEKGKRIEIRIPLVPGCNDDNAQLEATGEFLGKLRIESIKLLPYHSYARSKYAALDMPDTMPQVDPPDAAHMEHAASILRRHGLVVNIG